VNDFSERALVLAPQGRDSQVAAAMLAEARIESEVCPTLSGLVEELTAGAGMGVVTEEALKNADLKGLAAWIEGQPEWSDIPFILITQRGGGLERNPAARRHLDTLGNVTFLERPFHPTTLISLAQSALRGRRRQYEARARLVELHEWGDALERRVEERTKEHEAVTRQLHEAQKLETLGQLTGGVAHDFNNLLTPITGALDLLQRKYGESDPRTARLVGNALLAADRARTLVQRLLGFARRQTLQTSAVDIAGLIKGMRDLIISSLGPMIELRISTERDLQPAIADPNQLELAILNLCVNARDAMPDGGTLTVAAEHALIGPGSNLGLSPGHYVRVSLIDTGEGMDAKTLARAVEPFFSTKEVGRGTGLGLSMVHGLANQLSGGFDLHSVRGQGTRADLYLPATEAQADARTKKSLVAIRTGRPLNILLVDDEDLVRIGTAEMLRDLGHRVTEASGGTEALARLALDPGIETVITDYKMPRMDGGELARRIWERRADMPILLITGYTGSTSEVPDLPFLAKPFGQAELSAALNRLIGDDGKVVRLKPSTRKS
jgi:signal transduction histidine kinase/ActR/RegA family two-component response regulator